MSIPYNFPYIVSILGRFLLYFIISSAGIFSVLLIIEHQKFKLELARSQEQETLRLALTARALHSDLREAVTDLRLIAALPALRDYLSRETTVNRARIEQEFVNLAQHLSLYDQIRYIDTTGMERVRVNFDGRNAVPVPAEQLQDKSQRYYFRNSIILNANAVYVSPLDLNIEQGRIERPFKPMIRLAKTVYDSAGQLKGVVVLNYLAATLLEDFHQHMTDSWGEPAMVNLQGYWLYSVEPSDEWGFMLGNDATFAKRYPEAWALLVGQKSGAVRTENGLFLFDTVQPYAINESTNSAPGAEGENYISEIHWKLTSRVAPQAVVFSPLSVLQTWPTEAMGLLLVVGVLTIAPAWLRTYYVANRKALKESYERYRLLFESVAEGVLGVDLQGRCIFVNPSALRLLGYHDANQLIGKEVHPLIHHTRKDGTPCLVQECRVYGAFRDDRDFYTDDECFWRPDGTYFEVEYRSHPIRHDGSMAGSVATFIDISERRKAEFALREVQANLNAAQRIAHLGSWELDVASGKTYWSDEFFRICGLSPQSIQPTTEFGLSLIHPEDRDRAAKAIQQAIDEDKQYRIKKRIVRPDGSIRHVISEGEVIRDETGRAVKVFGSFLDITERELAEQQLRDYREHLEKMVDQRTAALQASYQELESFSYSIAHDLRTPLRAITSFSQILQNEAGPKLNEQERQDLQRIVNAGKSMAQLIDDILELARISRSEFHVETVNLSDIAKAVGERLQQVDPQRRVRVDIQPGLTSTGDSQLLRVVLENLLANAWKYSANCSNARIEFGMMEKDNEKVFYVRDNGVGFDMRYAEKLFKPFQRLHAAEDYEGTGIGLASVLSAVQRHNGKVWTESKPGQGATFYFTLPAFQSTA